MADDFNPYHVWLSIPPDEQPANHYRLLSLRLFETSGDVIDSAADRQMAHLRTFQSGKHGELTQRLLNEVAAARVCLLDPKKRAAYDQQLRAKLPPPTPAAPETGAPGGSAIHRQPPRRPTGAAPAVPTASIPVAAALPQPADQWDDLLGDPAAKPARRSGGKSATAGAAKGIAAKRDATNRSISYGIAAAVLVVIAGIGLFVLNGSPATGTLVFDWPIADRADTTVTVDNVAVPAPASGAWEFQCPPGEHHIVAQHLAYKLDADVSVAAGEQKTVPADWKPKATLVLNWPLAIRAGADLRVDGRAYPVTQREPMEIAVAPGMHVVQITPRNSQPIVTSKTVAAGERELMTIAPPAAPAKLVFDWPADDRKDAELTVDGHSREIDSGANPLELTVPPGKHVVRITRAGFESFHQSVELSAGANQAIKPTWTPEKKALVVVETAPPAETTRPAETAPQPAKKLAPPSAAEIERISKEVDNLYKTTGAALRDPAKAQELYDVAAKDGSSPPERYVLLMKGAEIAAAGGDLNLALSGIDTLDSDYDIAALGLKQKLLDKFIISAKPDQVEAAIPVVEQLVGQAMAADQYDTALMFADAAKSAATKAKIATPKEVEDRLSRRRRNIRQMAPIYAAAKKAQETLNAKPADPAANLVVGRWRCFYKNEWPTGLPLLAKGSDEKLKSLAEAELEAPADADRQVQLADGWWDLAQKEAGIARDSLHLHAGEIYQAAMPNLASALKKVAIEKRLAEIADVTPPPAAAAPGAPPPAVKFPLGRWVNVLRLVDTTKGTVSGSWSRRGEELSVEPSECARIAVPVEIAGGYDLEVAFTRTSGNGDVSTLIPVGPGACALTLSCYSGRASGLSNVNGHSPIDPENPAAVTPGSLENDHRYRLRISTRILTGGRASVNVSLDGRPYLPRWEGDASVLGDDQHWKMPSPAQPGLGAYRSDVTFHSARLRMISGRAMLTSELPPVFKTALLGGGGGGAFEDRSPVGGMLVGFRIVKSGGVNQLQPFYRTPGGIVPGTNFGRNGGTEVSAMAKDGYAVGAIVTKTGGSVDGFKAVFMRVRGQRLDPSDSYESEWLGGRGGGGERTLTGEGSPIVGVCGRCGDWIDAIGLIVEGAPENK